MEADNADDVLHEKPTSIEESLAVLEGVRAYSRKSIRQKEVLGL
jgi:hypothetical protein